jgi:hypothetical protein
MLKDIAILSTITLGHLTYIALNPKTKGIVFRPNDKNETILSLPSIFSFMTFPLTKEGLITWHPTLWDINYPIILCGFYGLSKFII